MLHRRLTCRHDSVELWRFRKVEGRHLLPSRSYWQGMVHNMMPFYLFTPMTRAIIHHSFHFEKLEGVYRFSVMIFDIGTVTVFCMI